jgi:hypothetical protein
LTAKLCSGVLIATALGSSFLRAQPQDLSAVVAQFYPSVLTDLANAAKTGGGRDQCYAVLEADSNGQARTIVAAYTNLDVGAVRVLQANAAGYTIVAQPPADHELMGEHCEVLAQDLDGDARPEAIVSFSTRDNTSEWIYRWANGTLINLTPVTPVNGTTFVDSALENASFLDLDGDGILEAFSFAAPSLDASIPTAPSVLYRLSAGGYVRDRRVVGLWPFERGSGSPTTDVFAVRVPAGAQPPFALRVINGAGTTGTGHRVENALDSGRVWLNGTEIVHPSDFGSTVATIDRPVTLAADNELKVRLAGAPGGRITIVIDAASWTP